MNKKTRFDKGISLIVLVITIIVIVILAVAVILSIANNNPIEQAKKSKFQNDLKTMQEELDMYIASQTTDSLGEFDVNSLNLTEFEDIKSVITSVTDEYKDKVIIFKGELIFAGENTQEIQWASEIINILYKNIENSKYLTLSKCLAAKPKDLYIYGSSDGVGDKTNNIFNMNLLSQVEGYNTYNQNTCLWTTNSGGAFFRSIFYKAVGASATRNISKLLKVPSNTSIVIKLFDFKLNNTTDTDIKEYQKGYSVSLYDKDGNKISGPKYATTSNCTLSTSNQECYLDIQRTYKTGTLSFSKIQVAQGTEIPEVYEPYGKYKIVIKVNESKKFYVFLDEPLRQFEDYVDYVDVVNKKVHRNVKVNEDGSLSGIDEEVIEDAQIDSDIMLEEGDNTVSVETENTPSKIEITYNSK